MTLGNELERADKGVMGLLKAMTMTNTDRANSMNRSVVEYKPCDVDAFFEPSRGVYNALISGGDPRLRTSAIVAQTICATSNNFPVVIIHEGNHLLEQQLRSNFSGSGRYKEISSGNPCFEPFCGLSELEISNQILETAPKDYDIKYNARYYIEGISAYLKASGKNLSFKLFSTCPHSMIFDKVDDLEMQGKISDHKAQEIKSKLMMGQSENYKLDSFLASLRMEIEPLMYVSKRGQHPLNIVTALKHNTILCFDLSSVTNKLLLNTIIYQLKLALTRGLQYQIVIDSIPIDSNESYASYIRTPSDKACKTITTDDFYAMVGGDEKVFSAVVGNTQTLIVMNHSSGHSATKWAEVFGQYDKFEESYSTSRGGSRRTPFSILSSPNYNRTVNVSKNREYIVKPETITRLGNGEAFILSAALGQLCHLYLTG
jgi:hypothetical protein